MTFSDVMDRYGHDIKPEFLENAYKRVGRSFAGQLAQTFVLLKDAQEVVAVSGDGGASGGGSGEIRGRVHVRGGTPNRLPRAPRGGGARTFHPDVTGNFCKEVGHYKGQCPKNQRGTSTPRGIMRGNTKRKRARSEDVDVGAGARGGRGAPQSGPGKMGRVEWADAVE